MKKCAVVSTLSSKTVDISPRYFTLVCQTRSTSRCDRTSLLYLTFRFLNTTTEPNLVHVSFTSPYSDKSPACYQPSTQLLSLANDDHQVLIQTSTVLNTFATTKRGLAGTRRRTNGRSQLDPSSAFCERYGSFQTGPRVRQVSSKRADVVAHAVRLIMFFVETDA